MAVATRSWTWGMAFWGVEVKPRKSFTLKFSDFEGPRLHLSQATLGNTKSDGRTIVKCSVANLPTVYLCSLLPGTAETCSLDLYFDGDVTFSIKGSASVHLVGYFDGTFDGDESGEDVEDDGYSDEEEEEDSEDTSMDGFIVSGDEDDYDEEWSSEEDLPTKARKSAVVIEELPDEPGLNVSKKKIENQERSLVSISKKSKHQEANGSTRGSIEGHKDTNGDGNLKQESEDLKTSGVTDYKHTSSSEDEDGFHVKRKRILKDDDNIQPSKKKSAGTQAEAPQTVIAPAVDHGTDTDSKGSSKKKKKKKKKSKNSPEVVSTPPATQGNGSSETPSEQADSAKKGKERKAPETPSKQGSKITATSSEQDVNKKGTVRKYPNGLEIENTSMGKPDGKQATPGKKVGVIYTGRLRSNGKIFDSNVGNKPFFFRLGVGEVIKGWDIGVNGMRVGDKRRLTIPPNMAYGSKGVSGIPPNSWLVFTVELAEVK